MTCFAHLPTVPHFQLGIGHGSSNLCSGAACWCRRDYMNYVLKKLCLCFLTCLVVLRGIGTEACLCFASFGNLSELEWLPRWHLLRAHKDPSHLGQGMVGGASSRQIKKPRTVETEKEDTWLQSATHMPGPDTGSEKTWEDARLESLAELWAELCVTGRRWRLSKYYRWPGQMLMGVPKLRAVWQSGRVFFLFLFGSVIVWKSH